jgi:hypothetical protein
MLFIVASLAISEGDFSKGGFISLMGEIQYNVLGPVYTTVEKSTGHEKKGVSQL